MKNQWSHILTILQFFSTCHILRPLEFWIHFFFSLPYYSSCHSGSIVDIWSSDDGTASIFCTLHRDFIDNLFQNVNITHDAIMIHYYRLKRHKIKYGIRKITVYSLLEKISQINIIRVEGIRVEIFSSAVRFAS